MKSNPSLKWMANLKLVMILFLLGVLGSGCSKPQNENAIRISSWGDAKENDILTGLIHDFQKAHPDIQVELQRVPWGDYKTKLLVQFAGGNAPDVVFVSTDNVSDLYYRGILEPLNSYIQADSQFSLKDSYPSLINRFTIDGNLYVVPRDIAPVCLLYYNKKAFDEAGIAYPQSSWTWADFLTAAKALTKRGADGHVTQWGFAEDYPMIEPWVYSAGGRWVDNLQKPTKWVFNSPEFVKGLEMRADFILKDKVMPGPGDLTAMGGVGASDLFQNGTAAMFISGLWKTPQFRDINSFDWDVALIPKGPGGRYYSGGGSGYGILSVSKHKKEAWQLVSYLAGPEGETKMASTGLVQPALKTIANSPAFLDGQKPMNKKILLQAVSNGVFLPFMDNWLEVYQGTVLPTCDRIWSGEITPNQAVSQMWDKIKDVPFTGYKGESK